MRKLLLFLTFILIATFIKAQIGIQAGTDFYASKVTSNNISVKYNYRVGFTGGVFYSIALKNGFSITPALDFIQKGGKITIKNLVDGNPVSQVKSTLILNYIQVPC